VELERVNALKLPYRNGSYYAFGNHRSLFLSNPHHHICRLNPDDYTLSWEHPWTHIREKTLVGDTLIFSGYDSVHGLNAETGEERWKHKATGWAEHGQGRLILYLQSCGYVIIDPQTGDVERRLSPPSFQGCVVRTLPHCAILHGKANDNQMFRAFEFDAQQVRWEFSPRRHLALTSHAHITPTVVGMSSDTSVLLLELDGHLIAVRVSDGVVVWQRAPSGQNYHRSCAGLLFLLENRDLVCLDIASGDIVWRMPPPPNSPYGFFSLACDVIYRGLLVLSDSTRILLASPQDGTIHATYTVSKVARIDVWNERLIAIMYNGRVDLLVTSDSPAPKRRTARIIALSTPSSAERDQRAEQRRASRLSPPRPTPVPTIEVIASIPTGTSRTPRIPTPVVGPNGVFFVLRDDTGAYVGIRKHARSTYERVWEIPPIDVVQPAWATDAHLVCGRGIHDRVEVLDTADGRSLWSTESQRGESWAWRELVVTSPYEPAEIRLLDPATGQCERTIRRPLEHLCDVSGDLALVCATRPVVSEAFGLTFKVPIAPFAVVDLETGRVKWQRAIFERLPQELDPHWNPKIFGVGPRTAVAYAGDHLAGVDLATGDFVWQMSVAGPSVRPVHFAHNRIWMTGGNDGLRIVHADTGEVTDIEGRGGLVFPEQIWGDFAVCCSSKSLDLYHPNGTSMRLKLRNEARAAIEASPDLILVEPHRLRIVRQVVPSSPDWP
jgi:outer membrane protein assembly factor BamB